MVDAIYVMFIERAMKREKNAFVDRKRRLLSNLTRRPHTIQIYIAVYILRHFERVLNFPIRPSQ